jgi:hypothetical protein
MYNKLDTENVNQRGHGVNKSLLRPAARARHRGGREINLIPAAPLPGPARSSSMSSAANQQPGKRLLGVLSGTGRQAAGRNRSRARSASQAIRSGPRVGRRAGDGQVVQDRPPLPLEGGEEPAVRRSRPRRQATVSGELRKRSSQPNPTATVTPAGTAKLGATRAVASQAATPAATTAATRQGRRSIPRPWRWGIAGGGELSQGLVGLGPADTCPLKLPGAIPRGLIEQLAEPVAFGPQFPGGQPAQVQAARGVDRQGLVAGAVPPPWGLAVAGQVLFVVGGQLAGAVGLPPDRELGDVGHHPAAPSRPPWHERTHPWCIALLGKWLGVRVGRKPACEWRLRVVRGREYFLARSDK